MAVLPFALSCHSDSISLHIVVCSGKLCRVFKETRSSKKLHIIFAIRLHKCGSILLNRNHMQRYTHAHLATVQCFEWNETELSIILLPLRSCEWEYQWPKNFGIFYNAERGNICCIFSLVRPLKNENGILLLFTKRSTLFGKMLVPFNALMTTF